MDPLNQELKKLLSPEQYQNFLKLGPLERFSQLSVLLHKNPEQTMAYLGEKTGLTCLDSLDVPSNAADLLPIKLIYEYQCLPVKEDSGRILKLACVWPLGAKELTWLRSVALKPVQMCLALPEVIAHNIKSRFGVGSASLEDSQISSVEESQVPDQVDDQNAAVIRFVNDIIQGAIQDRATDIHFEPLKEGLQIRYRIDGQLVPVTLPNNLVRFKGAIISRLKIMARLNISERRRPQDGRIAYQVGETELDLRISTFPTLYGESISLRLLNDKNLPSTLSELGFLPEDQKIILKAVERPFGMILVTGPTGSGKSTSLSSFIRIINHPSRRIITVEDPIEYEITGVNQAQVNPEIDLTFASCLRHILRQDPDVIMVGEIRDKETAEIAIRASQTGHLVLSTLHTNDAPGAMTRLVDMDIEPFLIASSVELVIAQRLVRRLCPACKKPMSSGDPSYLQNCLKALHLNPDSLNHEDLSQIREPEGCKACNGLGFRGRVGIFEILRNTEEIHEMVIARASAGKIREVALRQGMRSMQACGWEMVKLGITSLSEVMRFAQLNEEE